MSKNTPISHVSDTARWVAIYRAMETESPAPLFRDPYARRLGGARGEEILESMKNGEKLAWPMIVRTAVMDELIMHAIETRGVDAVLNLAAGLDARPYRLELPAELQWIDADLPDMLAYKEQQLEGETPKCRLESVKIDLTDVAARRALFERVGAAAENVLVISEGLLIYLRPEQVTALAEDLRSQPPFRWWLIDLASPRILKMMEKTWGKQLRAGNAPFRFGPAEGTRFFEPSGWFEHEFRSTGDEARRLQRMPFSLRVITQLARILPSKKQEQFRRMVGTVMLRSRPHGNG